MTNNVTEEDIIERIRDGLQDAVEGKNLSWGKGTQVKKQKYVDIALNHHVGPIMTQEGQRSPVTRSWYKYGCVQTVSTSRTAFSPDNTVQKDVNEMPEEQWPFDPPEELLVPEEGTGVPPSEHDIAELNASDFLQFFIDTNLTPPLDSEHWAEMSNLQFLQPYYTETAPPELRDLYVANVMLRQTLGEAFETARLIERNRTELLTESTEFDSDWKPDTYRRTAGQAAVKLRLAIRGSPFVPDTLIDLVFTFTDTLEDFLLMLTDLEETDIRPQHYRTLKTFDEFFDGTIWEWIARYISYATVVGPQAEIWREGSRKRIAAFAAATPGEVTTLRTNLREQNLLATMKMYSEPAQDEDSAKRFMSVIDEATIRNRTTESPSGDDDE